jgi:outer membrane protein OmpA-like peptidoglycan-associated protein
MSDENNHHEDEHSHQNADTSSENTTNSGAAAPASNQNLIAGLVLGAAILLLLVLVFNMQGGDSDKLEKKDDEVTELTERLRTLQSQVDSEARRQGYGSAGSNQYGIDPQKLAEQIATEANALAGAIGSFGDSIRQKEALLQSAKDTEQLLNRRIQDLQRQLNDLGESARKSMTLQKELDSTRVLLDRANEQIQELRKRPDTAVVDQLRSENEDLRARLASLTNLESENRELREKVRELQTIVDRATLYVESVEALPANAQLLYRELERLEGTDPNALAGKYGLLAEQLQARPLRSIDFETGSSQLTTEEVATIRNEVASSEPGSYLLVVGYASTEGNFKDNRQLSANRATAVASQVNLVKKPNQKVRAVFLNETDRFSREHPEHNQVCEVWEIQQ